MNILKAKGAELEATSEKYAAAVKTQSKIMSDFSTKIRKLQGELDLKRTKRKTEVRPLQSLKSILKEQVEVLQRQSSQYSKASEERSSAAKELSEEFISPLKDALGAWENDPTCNEKAGALLLRLKVSVTKSFTLLNSQHGSWALGPLILELDGKMVDFDKKMSEYKAKLEELAQKSEELEVKGARDRKKSAVTIAKLQQDIDDMDTQIKDETEEGLAEIKRLRGSIEDEESEVNKRRGEFKDAETGTEGREELGPLLEQIHAKCGEK